MKKRIIITILVIILACIAPAAIGIIWSRYHPYQMTKQDADNLRAEKARYDLNQLLKQSKEKAR